jgi:hypothetical protein
MNTFDISSSLLSQFFITKELNVMAEKACTYTHIHSHTLTVKLWLTVLWRQSHPASWKPRNASGVVERLEHRRDGVDPMLSGKA